MQESRADVILLRRKRGKKQEFPVWGGGVQPRWRPKPSPPPKRRNCPQHRLIVVSDLCCDTWRRMSWIEGVPRGQRLKLLRGWAGPWLILFKSVLRIRIHRIHMFLGLHDPDPDPLVRGMDWIRLRIGILLSSCKNSKKNLDLWLFFTFYLWKMM